MSIFDNLTKTPEQHVQELNEQINAQIAIEENMVLCLGSGGHIVFTEDVDGFISHLSEVLDTQCQVYGTGVLAEELKHQQGRPIIRWDASSFRKNDAVGSMYLLSKQPKEPRPVLIVENITELPDGDRSVYEDPVLLENILLHSWKNDVIHLTHHQNGPFELMSKDYSIIFLVHPDSISKLHHRISDGMAVIQL